SRRRGRAWSVRGRRGAPRRSSAPLAVQRPELGELALEQRAEPADILLVLPLHLGGLTLNLGLRGARRVEEAPPLGLGLAHHDLRLPLRRRMGRLAQLLRRDQRLVHRALPLAVGAELLAQRRHPLLEHGLLAQDPLQLVRHADAEVLHADRLVAAQALAKLLFTHVERCEVKRGFAHVRSSVFPFPCSASAPASSPASPAPPVALGPKRTVPKRITVAPSSTAIA